MMRNYAALLLIPATLLVVSCSRPPEQQFLTQFFRAARGRDLTTAGRMSAVMIDPREQGSVEDFSIESIGAETRTPLTFKPLFEAEVKAKQEERAFLDTKIAYQTANIKSIEEVLKIEQLNPTAKLTPAQEKTKLEWDKWREGISAHARATSNATAAIERGDRRGRSLADAAGPAAARPAGVRGRDDQERRDGEGVGEIARRRNGREDARDYDRASGGGRPRGAPHHHKDHGPLGTLSSIWPTKWFSAASVERASARDSYNLNTQ